ncbi:MAG: hypothetical protein LC115_02545 [Bacteroidia bacterium]|nr:hypothetical protein [Bacteroidia bacterium]
MKKDLHYWAVFLLWGFLVNNTFGQIIEPIRVKFGGSIGAGGLHAFFQPSADVHWRGASLRLSAGTHYIGIGYSQKIGFYRPILWWRKPTRRLDRPIFLSFNYLEDYWLANKTPRGTPRRDRDIFMLLAGVHANLNYVGSVYFQVAFGAMYLIEKYNPVLGKPIKNIHIITPMVEVRLGGIIVSHKTHDRKPGYGKTILIKRIPTRHRIYR